MSNILDTFNSLNTTWDSSGFPGFPTGTVDPWLPKKHDPTQDNPGFWSGIKSGLADADWDSAFGSPQEEAVAAANSWKNAKTLGGLEGGFSPTSFSPQHGIKTGIYTPSTPQYTVIPGQQKKSFLSSVLGGLSPIVGAVNPLAGAAMNIGSRVV